MPWSTSCLSVSGLRHFSRNHYAGQGGYQIDVSQHTQLDGSVIASTADADQNRLSTGTPGWRDIHNKADYTSQQQSVRVAGGGAVGSDFTGNMPGGMLTAYNHSGHDSSTTYAAVSEGALEIRDPANQQQDIATLNHDVEHANNVLSPIFDKEKEQRRLREVQLIAEIGTQVMDVIRTHGEIEATKAGKEELERQGIQEPGTDATSEERKAYREALQNTAAYKDTMGPYGTGGDFQRAAQAVTAALQGLAGGDLGGALAGASAPYLAQVIKQVAGDNEAARIMAHAVLGAIVAEVQGNSAAAGAAGAAGGELMARLISQQLYGDVRPEDLSEEQKQTVSALSSLAAGLAGGVVGGDTASAIAGAQGGKNAVENNYLTSQQMQSLADELKGCQVHGNCDEISQRYFDQHNLNERALAEACDLSITACQAKAAEISEAVQEWQELGYYSELTGMPGRILAAFHQFNLEAGPTATQAIALPAAQAFIETLGIDPQSEQAMAIAGTFATIFAGRAAGPKEVPQVKWSAQEKHFPGHNSYTPGRSVLTSDPRKLAEGAGSGVQVGDIPVGLPGSKERVNFGGGIGTYIDRAGVATPTSNGIIHYSKDGVHIVPSRP
ncbi:Pre-toxin domain with VENN motif protein [compost metagenome]